MNNSSSVKFFVMPTKNAGVVFVFILTPRSLVILRVTSDCCDCDFDICVLFHFGLSVRLLESPILVGIFVEIELLFFKDSKGNCFGNSFLSACRGKSVLKK